MVGSEHTVAAAYGTSTARAKRTRSTAAQMVAMDYFLRSIAEADSEQGRHPVTVRQVYYRAAARGLVTKDTKGRGYKKVVRHLGAMRESGELPWSWIADNARARRQLTQHAGLLDALHTMQQTYRRDYWAAQPLRVEVWVESDAIASALGQTILPYGVPIFTCRGQASKTYIRAAVDDSLAIAKPIHILYAGDWDPTGLAIDRSLDERYGRYSDNADVTITRVAVTPGQIRDYDLDGTAAKTGDPNYKRFLTICDQHGLLPVAIEAEALPPAVLRQAVAEGIESLIDPEAWRAVIGYEHAEVEQLKALVGAVDRGEHLS